MLNVIIVFPALFGKRCMVSPKSAIDLLKIRDVTFLARQWLARQLYALSTAFRDSCLPIMAPGIDLPPTF